jgi:hypothetical protein
MDRPLVEDNDDVRIPVERYLGIWCTSCCVVTKCRCRNIFSETTNGEIWECSSMFCCIPLCCAYTGTVPCIGAFWRSGSRRNKLALKFGEIVLGEDLRIPRTRYRLDDDGTTLIDHMPLCSSQKREYRLLRLPCCFC